MKRAVIFILLLLQGAVAFGLKPKKEYVMLPDRLGMNYTVDTIVTKDGFRLMDWDIITDTVMSALKNKRIVYYNGGHLQGMWKMSQKAYGDLYVADVVSFLNDLQQKN